MNRISNLQRADGTMCATEEEDQTEIQSFYQALFTTQGFHEMDELLQFVPERVSMEMNTSLDKPFEADEVKKALFQMSLSKAPGVDGFTVSFFQRHWEVIKDDLVPAILDFVNGGEIPSGFNNTSITLIRKVRNPQSIS